MFFFYFETSYLTENFLNKTNSQTKYLKVKNIIYFETERVVSYFLWRGSIIHKFTRWTRWHTCRPNILIHIGEELMASLVGLYQVTLWYVLLRTSKHDTSLSSNVSDERHRIWSSSTIIWLSLRGAAHACVPCTCTPCLHAWSEGTGVRCPTLQCSALRALWVCLLPNFFTK